MNNRIKSILLIILVFVLTVECVFLYKIKGDITKLDERLKTEKTLASKGESEESVDPPIPPMITINSEINQKLERHVNQNAIIDRSVAVARGIVNQLINNGVYLSDVTVSNVSFIERVQMGAMDSVDIFNVEVLITDADGVKTTDDSKYILFYNRWDEDGEGSYYISSLTSEEIENKYGDRVEEFDGNINVAACTIERDEYLKRGNLIPEDFLENSAYVKALAYAEDSGVGDVISDKYTVSVEGDTKSFYFDTSKNVTITVVYRYFDDMEKWAFLNANT